MGAYLEWVGMFSPEMENVPSNKIKHLKNMSMIMLAFENEVSAMREYLQNEFEKFEKSQDKITQHVFIKPASNIATSNRNSMSNDKKKIAINSGPECSPTASKDSPDVFAMTYNDSLNETTIISSPEIGSPKIKKKKYLPHHRNNLQKVKQLNASKTDSKNTSFSGSKNQDNLKNPFRQQKSKQKLPIVINFDDLIAGTPEVGNCSKSIQSLRKSKTNVKKKLFDKNPSKKTGSMVTITQMFDLTNDDNKRKRSQARIVIPGCESFDEDVADSSMCLENILESIDSSSNKENNQSCHTEIMPRQGATETGPKCRPCIMKGSPCPKHCTVQDLKEPDQTYSGFWDLNFTTTTNKRVKNKKEVIKPNDCNNSTLLI